jgi:hypothetical protein
VKTEIGLIIFIVFCKFEQAFIDNKILIG